MLVILALKEPGLDFLLQCTLYCDFPVCAKMQHVDAHVVEGLVLDKSTECEKDTVLPLGSNGTLLKLGKFNNLPQFQVFFHT